MTTFEPGDRVKIADDSPYNSEFAGRFATVVGTSDERHPQFVTVSQDSGLNGMISVAHLTYIPKKGDVVHIAAPSTYRGAHEVLSADNDETVTISQYSGGLQVKFNTQTVVLVRRATAQKETPVTEQYPVGCTVRYVEGTPELLGQFGEVTGRSGSGSVTVCFPSVPSGRADKEWTVSAESLERVHVLTHDELVVLDQARRMSAPGDTGLNILDAHLRPTVTRTFEVTVVQPAGTSKPVDTAWLQQNVQRHAPNTEITIEEKTR